MAAPNEVEDSVIIDQTMSESGLNGVKDMLMKKLGAWKELKLSIAVIGNSGTGKSTYINAIRDLTADDKGSAEVGATEKTNERKSYIHPKQPNLTFWDLPGVGTKSHPRETYLKQVNFYSYDFFLILSAARFTENDSWLAKEIQRSGKKFIFIRTKIDDAIQGERLAKPKSFNERDVLQEIGRNCRKNLKEDGLQGATVFLLSSFHKESWDFQAAKEKLIEDFPDLKKEAILFSLSCQTTNIIDKKKEMLSRRIYKTAVASAIVATAPVSGVSMAFDVGILEREAKFYRKQFGLDEQSLKSTSECLHIGIDTLKKTIVQTATTLSELVISHATSEVVESAARIGIPVIGSLIAAGISYTTIYLTLQNLLKEAEDDARRLAAFVQEKFKEKVKEKVEEEVKEKVKEKVEG